MGKYAEAKEQLEQMLKIKEDFYGCGSSQLASTINSLAEAHLGLDDCLTAKSLCEKALRTKPDDLILVDVICNLGQAYMQVYRLEEAKLGLEGAWETLTNSSTYSDHGQLLKAKVLSLLGIIYRCFTDAEKVKTALNSCATLLKGYEGNPNTEAKVVDIKCHLGYALAHLDDLEKGLELLESGAVYFESNYGSDHYKFVDTLHTLGISYGLGLELKKGLVILERCVELAEHCYGNDSIAMAKFLHSLGISYSRLNYHKKAVEAY